MVLAPVLVCLAMLRRGAARPPATLLVIGCGCASVEIVKAIVDRPPTGGGWRSYPSGQTGFALSLAVAAYFLARGTRWAHVVSVLGVLWVASSGTAGSWRCGCADGGRTDDAASRGHSRR